MCSFVNKICLNSEDLDEVAHNEPPHQDLCCLQIQLFLYLEVKLSSGFLQKSLLKTPG